MMGSIISGIGSYIGGQQAAAAAKQAAQMQQEQYQTTRGDELPFITTGQNALQGAYDLATGSPTGGGPNYLDLAYQQYLPPKMTQSELEQTPGYQFNLSQGLKAVQGAAAAKGLGVSGASLKGAGTYATGLADATYQNQFANAQQRFTDVLNLNTQQQGNLTNQFNRYNALITTGAGAASQLGTQGTALANQAGTFTTTAGQDQGAGTAALAKGVGQAVNQLAGYYMNPTTGGQGA
jgi:hypothetical protein